MYDQRQEPNEFVADTLDEARSNAAKFFEVEIDQLKVVVPKDGEIYGAGGRAVIVAMPAEVAARGPRRDSGGGSDRGRGDREGRRDRPERGERSERGDRPERGGRGRDREGRGEGRGHADARHGHGNKHIRRLIQPRSAQRASAPSAPRRPQDLQPPPSLASRPPPHS